MHDHKGQTKTRVVPVVQGNDIIVPDTILVGHQSKKKWERLARGSQSLMETPKITLPKLISKKRELSDLEDYSNVPKNFRIDVYSDNDFLTETAEAVVQFPRAL